MKTRDQKIEEWRRRKELGVAYLILVGINGLIPILLNLDFENIQSAGWDSVRIGEKIGLGLYFVAMAAGIVVWYACRYRQKQSEQEPLKKIIT